jgi:hypothetical protein
MIKVVFEYYRKKMTGAVFTNPVMKWLLWGTRYCLDCLNRFVKFVCKNAYIMTAITSSSFCPAAWKAFILILASAGRFAVSNFLGAAIMWVGRAFTTFLTAAIGYIMVAFIPSVEVKLSSPIMPTVIIGMMAFVVSGVFLSLFSFSIDTILLCFLVDEGWA